MANKKTRVDKFSEEYIRKHRTMPTANIVLLVCIVIVQIAMIVAAILYQPKPQDRIEEYAVTVEPREDGSLDIEYSFVWTALDTSEELTWIEIGLPNFDFLVDTASYSDTIRNAQFYSEGDYVALHVYLKRAYRGGETLRFSFRVNQRSMLCQNANGYYYEFIPGWFNATPVEHYTFRWKTSEGMTGSNAAAEEAGYKVWEGEMPCGSYVKLCTEYASDAFSDPKVVLYRPFDDGDVVDDLAENKTGIVVLIVFLAVLLIAAEVYLVDSMVSYHRGRGFLTGYGHHVHYYGRVNPRYRTAQAKHAGGSGGSFRGGGCACACACACAGGGRAGCSQKDGYVLPKLKKKS